MGIDWMSHGCRERTDLAFTPKTKTYNPAQRPPPQYHKLISLKLQLGMKKQPWISLRVIFPDEALAEIETQATLLKSVLTIKI